MRYDFDKVEDRRNSHSLKWDVRDNELPMWVADMDFKAAPEIIEAIRQTVDHGIFGYPVVPDEWYDAYINWWKDRHDFVMRKDGLIFCVGVIPAVSALIREFSDPGSDVIIQPPVYNCFYNVIKGNGRGICENALLYRDGVYEMDLDDLERKMSDPATGLMILCNPQNPSGRIWEKGELGKVGELAKKYNVTVISDEIHCDITEPGKEYVPFASVSDVCAQVGITCIAPTKTFNIAGLKSAALYVSDPKVAKQAIRALDTDEVSEPGSFATRSAIAAFENGAQWLDELRMYISKNRRCVEEYLHDEIPQIKAVKGEATYLVWLDISGLGKDVSGFGTFLREKTGLFLSPGRIFGKHGESFLRMNIACPESVLLDGLSRLKDGVRQWPHLL